MSSTLTRAKAMVTRRVVAIAAIAGVLLCAAVGATPREGNPSGDPESASAQVAAAPRTKLADAQPAAAPQNTALPDAVLSGTSPFKESARHIAVSVGLAGAAAGLGLCGGAFAYLVRGPITEITVMNLGIFAFLFALNGNFRHYHVSFRYPRWLERWLQSPGMHHVHHGYLPHHRDKNLGLVTSVWDRLVGTLYIGEPYEPTPWGLGPDEQAHYTIFIQNVVGPFQEVYALLARRETASSNT